MTTSEKRSPSGPFGTEEGKSLNDAGSYGQVHFQVTNYSCWRHTTVPLPGGAADKVGNRYENRWTVRWLAGVLADEARSIRIEPPGAEGEGIEFWLDLADRRE